MTIKCAPMIIHKRGHTKIISWLVVLIILKHISQWEELSHIFWKIKSVWNHQPVSVGFDMFIQKGYNFIVAQDACDWTEVLKSVSSTKKELQLKLGIGSFRTCSEQGSPSWHGLWSTEAAWGTTCNWSPHAEAVSSGDLTIKCPLENHYILFLHRWFIDD